MVEVVLVTMHVCVRAVVVTNVREGVMVTGQAGSMATLQLYSGHGDDVVVICHRFLAV